MLCPAATNDNNPDRDSRSSALAQRVPDHLEGEVRRLQIEAERASLDALAHILAIAAREANRVAEWERRIRAELMTAPDVLRRSGDR